MCEDIKLKYIVAIVPEHRVYEEAVGFDIDHSVMEYEGHDIVLDVPRFKAECEKIEELRGRRENVMVFCNNGYQRSLPFLCYYLCKCHADEVPTLERAVDIILPQVDKLSYAANRDKYIETLTQLFRDNGLL